MENKQLLKNLTLVAIGVASRLIPHPANFTAILATGIYSKNYFIPLFSMMISDFILGFDSLPMRVVVYGSIIGGIFITKKFPVKYVFLTTILASTLFFVITNYAVWSISNLYTKNFSGLITCYLLAIPFFKNALLGDLFYTGMLFGVEKLAFLKIFRPSALKQDE